MSQASESKPAKAQASESKASGPKPAELQIKWAYALVEDPARPGRFFSLELNNVVCESMRHLEGSARPEYLGTAASRLSNAIFDRGAKRKWST